MIPTIETSSYILRGLELEDAEELYIFMSDPETMKFITAHPVKNLEEMKEEVKESLENYERKKEIPWVILLKESKEVIGFFRFHKLNEWHQKAEIGVIIRKEYQKQGVMTEVLATMLSYGFNELKLNRIVGDIFAGNRGSQKLLERFGFKKEGVLRETDFDGRKFHDTIVYSLLKREYDSSRS